MRLCAVESHSPQTAAVVEVNGRATALLPPETAHRGNLRLLEEPLAAPAPPEPPASGRRQYKRDSGGFPTPQPTPKTVPFQGFRRWLSLLVLLALVAVPLACGESSPDVDPSADNAAIALPSPSAATLTPTATPPAPSAPTPVPSDVLAPSPAMARVLEGIAWLADGVTEGEFYQLSKAVDIAVNSPPLADELAAHWTAYGYSDTLLWHLDVIAPVDAAMGRRLLDLPWCTDSVTPTESSAAESLMDIWRSDPDLGGSVFALPWTLDGISASESAALWALAVIAYSDPSLVRQVLQQAESLLTLPGSLAADALAALGQQGEFPGDLRAVAAEPWFADGLDREEAAFVTALMPLAYEAPSAYASLLQSRFTLSRTVSPPLAGDIALWAFRGVPFSPGDDPLAVMEEAARLMEGFLGAPFPVKDVILMVVEGGGESGGLGVANHLGTHMRVTSFSGGRLADSSDTLRHELAQYYFGLGFAPSWLREGASDFMASYVRDRAGVQPLAKRAQAVAALHAACVEGGIENISHLNRLYDSISDTPPCAYTMGEHFLHQARGALGEEALAAALRELYRLGVSRDSLLPGTKEEIYQVFLRNAPPARDAAFRDLYRQIHGGVHEARSP